MLYKLIHLTYNMIFKKPAKLLMSVVKYKDMKQRLDQRMNGGCVKFNNRIVDISK
jgi:hypothetical protein